MVEAGLETTGAAARMVALAAAGAETAAGVDEEAAAGALDHPQGEMATGSVRLKRAASNLAACRPSRRSGRALRLQVARLVAHGRLGLHWAASLQPCERISLMLKSRSPSNCSRWPRLQWQSST